MIYIHDKTCMYILYLDRSQFNIVLVKENIKCIVQTLKCCGAVLEEEERSKPTNQGTTPLLGK